MKTIISAQISRQDYVDGHIFKLVQTVNPTKHPIIWDIEMIGDVRDIVEYWVVKRLKLTNPQDFYPSNEPQE